jgi:hypothetical protein
VGRRVGLPDRDRRADSRRAQPRIRPASSVVRAAAGIAFGLQAAVTKVFTDIIGEGLHAILRSWQTYALIASALVGFALQQGALKTGALAAALASSNAMTLLSSVALGLTVFSESLESGAVGTAVVIAGLGLIVVVVVLVRAPAAMPRTESPATD